MAAFWVQGHLGTWALLKSSKISMHEKNPPEPPLNHALWGKVEQFHSFMSTEFSSILLAFGEWSVSLFLVSKGGSLTDHAPFRKRGERVNDLFLTGKMDGFPLPCLLGNPYLSADCCARFSKTPNESDN